VVAAIRSRSRLLGEALGAARPSAAEPPWLTVTLAEANPLFAEKLQQQAAAIEEVVARLVGEPVRLRVTEPAAGDAAVPGARQLSESAVKAERLREFRAKDPTLDTAADALDLEIVD
jgi:hypothetical protein